MATMTQPRAGNAAPRKTLLKRLRAYFAKSGVFWLMALPGLILIFIFAYAPLPGIAIAFKNYKFNLGIWGSEWAGFNNFGYLFATHLTSRVIFNTLFMNALFIITGTIGGIILALLMYEVQHKLRARFYQSAFFFPSFISAVVISYFAFAFLSSDTGMINRVLAQLGMEPVPWYSSPEYWPAILVLINLWKGVGLGSILYLAGMLGINPEFYEAARIDGASKLKQIVYITLPLIAPIIVITTLLAIGRIFYADFGMFYVVTRNTPQLYPTTDVIDTFVFRSLRQLGDVGMAAAAGFMQSVIGFVLVIFSNLIVRRLDPDKALF
jgi:putative aldouronate transport system permease protein